MNSSIISDQKIFALIPARLASSRFPGKPLAAIFGLPMVVRVAELAAKAVGVEQTYVVTDSELILEVVKSAGFNSLLEKGAFRNGTERIASAVARNSELFAGAEVIINVQGDEPLVSPTDIAQIAVHKRDFPDGVVHGYAPIHSPERWISNSVPKVLISELGYLMYASRNPVPGAKVERLETEKTQNYTQVCIYGFSKHELNWFLNRAPGKYGIQEDIEIIRFIEHGYPVKMILLRETVAVDYPEDIEEVERILREGH